MPDIEISTVSAAGDKLLFVYQVTNHYLDAYIYWAVSDVPGVQSAESIKSGSQSKCNGKIAQMDDTIRTVTFQAFIFAKKSVTDTLFEHIVNVQLQRK